MVASLDRLVNVSWEPTPAESFRTGLPSASTNVRSTRLSPPTPSTASPNVHATPGSNPSWNGAARAASAEAASAVVNATAATTDMRLLNELHMADPLSIDALLSAAPSRVLPTAATTRPLAERRCQGAQRAHLPPSVGVGSA